MIFGWFRRRRRRKLLAQPFPAGWRAVLDGYRFYSELDADERGRLEGIVRVLVDEKNWEGVEIELTDEIRVTIAGLAALLILEIEHRYFRRVTSILVYPTTFGSVWGGSQHGVLQPEQPTLLGEAWYRGPIRLAWDSSLQGALNADDGRNVVLHEFAHRLDMQDGVVDGTPPLRTPHALAAWARIMSEEYERLQGRRRGKSILDPYGATNEGEFFAVATEAFFEKPRHMKRRHEELYAILAEYYRQDPEARQRRALSASQQEP